MPDEFTVTELRNHLLAAAGESEGADVGPDTLDTELDDLGYESLAILETGSRIERELGIRFDDADLFGATTPRALIDLVNAQLAITDLSS